MTQGNQSNEWNDPYKIVETGNTAQVSDEERKEIIEAVSNAYDEQHTTTPLDRNAGYKLKDLTPVGESPITDYEFTVQRFIGGTPGERYTGTVHFRNGGWTASYDKPEQGESILLSLRELFGSILPE